MHISFFFIVRQSDIVMISVHPLPICTNMGGGRAEASSYAFDSFLMV